MIGCNKIMIRHCLIRELIDIVPLNSPIVNNNTFQLACGFAATMQNAVSVALLCRMPMLNAKNSSTAYRLITGNDSAVTSPMTWPITRRLNGASRRTMLLTTTLLFSNSSPTCKQEWDRLAIDAIVIPMRIHASNNNNNNNNNTYPTGRPRLQNRPRARENSKEGPRCTMYQLCLLTTKRFLTVRKEKPVKYKWKSYPWIFPDIPRFNCILKIPRRGDGTTRWQTTKATHCVGLTNRANYKTVLGLQPAGQSAI